MATEDPWALKARRLLKTELKRREVGYHQLVEKLAALGVNETYASIANKLSRGAFTAAFLLQCMEAIGVENASARRRVVACDRCIGRWLACTIASAGCGLGCRQRSRASALQTPTELPKGAYRCRSNSPAQARGRRQNSKGAPNAAHP